jgi:hypothetical protein
MMKHVRSGFSLIEFLLYFVLMTMMVMLTMDWIVSCHVRVANISRMCTEYIALTAAHDLVMRDLACAHVDNAYWKKITPTGAIWSVGQNDIGWEVCDTILMRHQGLYDAERDAWLTVHSYKVADAVKRLTIVHDQQSRQASCCLEGQGDSDCSVVCRWVALYNGMQL